MKMMRIAITKYWTKLVQERQETTSAKCVRAHFGPRLCFTPPMCWSCVLLGPSGTMRVFMVILQIYGSSSCKEKVVMRQSLRLCQSGPVCALIIDRISVARLPNLTAFKDSEERT